MSRMGRAARFFAAGFDTAAIGVLAWSETGGRFAATFSEYILWGSVLAAAMCALVLLVENLAPVAWIGIGCILFGALLTPGSPLYGLLLLALSVAPRARPLCAP